MGEVKCVWVIYRYNTSLVAFAPWPVYTDMSTLEEKACVCSVLIVCVILSHDPEQNDKFLDDFHNADDKIKAAVL